MALATAHRLCGRAAWAGRLAGWLAAHTHSRCTLLRPHCRCALPSIMHCLTSSNCPTSAQRRAADQRKQQQIASSASRWPTSRWGSSGAPQLWLPRQAAPPNVQVQPSVDKPSTQTAFIRQIIKSVGGQCVLMQLRRDVRSEKKSCPLPASIWRPLPY